MKHNKGVMVGILGVLILLLTCPNLSADVKATNLGKMLWEDEYDSSFAYDVNSSGMVVGTHQFYSYIEGLGYLYNPYQNVDYTTHALTSDTDYYNTNPVMGNDGTSNIVAYIKKEKLSDGSSGPGQVYYQRVSDLGVPIGTPVQLTSDPYEHHSVEISDYFIIWIRDVGYNSELWRHIFAANNTHFVMSANYREAFKICKWHRAGIWNYPDGLKFVYHINWANNTGERIAEPNSSVDFSIQGEIGDRFIVWRDYVTDSLDIMAYDYNSTTYFTVTNTPGINESHPSTDGPWIVWEEENPGTEATKIVLKNMDTDEVRVVVDDGNKNRIPRISGDFVSFESNIDGFYNPFIYHIPTACIGRLGEGYPHKGSADIKGNLIAFSATSGGHTDIYATHFFGAGLMELGSLGGAFTSPNAINENGWIVGDSWDSADYTQAFLIIPEDTNSNGKPDTWFKDAGDGTNQLMINLGENFWQSTGKDINDLNQVLGGFYLTSSPPYNGFLYSQENGLINLGHPSGYGGVDKINNNGVILGSRMGSQPFMIWPEDTNSDTIPDTWFQDGGGGVNAMMVDIDPYTEREFLSLYGMNDSEVVVGTGWAFAEASAIAARWTQDNGWQDFGFSNSSYGFDVNNLGQVAGVFIGDELDENGHDSTHPFVWTENGGVVDLNEAAGIPSTGIGNEFNISESGRYVAGSIYDWETSTSKAFLYEIIPDTGAGSNIPFNQGNVSLLFDAVSVDGITQISESSTNPGPDDYHFQFEGHFFKVATTAIFDGYVTITLAYDDTAINNEQNLELLHLEDGVWVDVTDYVDTTNNLIVATVDSFSWFGLATPAFVSEPEGFQEPLSILVPEGDEVVYPEKAFKLGRTLPLRLMLYSSDGVLLTPSDVEVAPKLVGLVNQGEAPLSLDEMDLDAGEANDTGLYFRYSEEDGVWVYNLSTAGLNPGMYDLTVELPDGRRFVAGLILR